MKNTNQKKPVTIILCIFFGFSIIFNINSSLSKINFSNYQGDLENDDQSNLRAADEFVIPEPISDHLWSPDGTKLAYLKPPIGQEWNCEIWMADKSPNSAQLINHQLIYTGADWAGLQDWKDDWLLIMIRFEQGTPSSYYGRNELWKMRPDGTGLTQLTFTETNGIRTTWSNTAYTNRGTVGVGNFIPGTNLIYFSAHNGNGWYKSFVCDDDGTDGWYHISNPDYSFRYGLSPTGNKLLWGDATYWDNPLTIRASNIDGSGRVTIKNLPGRTTIIALADGNTMIWNQNDNIYAIDLDGTNERTVIDDAYVNQAWNYNPANDQELIFGSSRLDGNMHLFKMNVDGSDIVQLTDAGPYNDEFPILSPDGNYISYLRLPYDYDPQSNPRPHPYDLVVKSVMQVPTITINSPDFDDFYGSTAPTYWVTINGEYDAVWYTLDNGVTNITASGLNEIIDQTEWDKVADGIVNLRFYVNNSLGNLAYSDVNFTKDTVAPIVTINSPIDYEKFGKISPSYNISIVEPYLDTMWYTIDGGVTNISLAPLTGTIDQIEWDKLGNGTVSINFYADDESMNVGFAQVIIEKEATPPIITIISPNEDDLFYTIAPAFEIAIQELDLNTTWYTLDDGLTNYIFTGLTGSIDQIEWDKYGNGTVTIKFYANDTYGYENFTQVTVRKDTSPPTILINSPTSGAAFSAAAPAYDITVIDFQLDSMWYTIDEGVTNISISSSTGTIDQTEWDKKGEENVIIRFYANDTLGNTEYSEVTVSKDTITPVISINNPDPLELFGVVSPSYDLSIVESNLDSIWYTLDGGGTNITTSSLSGTIDQTEWNKYGNGTVTIQFYASDLAGHIDTSQVIVLKDIFAPIITINSPNTADLFSNNAPSFSISIVESSLDSMSYTIDGGATFISLSAFSGTIDQTEWDKLGNGTVTILFFAIDLVGNNGTSQIIVYKDIVSPIITINSPNQDEIFSSSAPAFDITVVDFRLDSMWYTIDNGLTIIPLVSTTGTVDQTEWDKNGGGDVHIRFYANDTLGNSGYMEVLVIKDVLYGIDPVDLLTPSTSSELYSNNLDFSWTSLDAGFGAVNFTIQISDTTDFSHIIYQSDNIAETPIFTNFSGQIPIAQGQYYWRVRPTYRNNIGTWSDYFSFILHINNYAPSMESIECTPTTGTRGTIFRFTATYYDLDDNPPLFVNIILNGIPYSMEMVEPLDEDFTDGCIYQYLTLLTPSTTAYTFSFECSDGAFQYSTSTYQGPLVESDSTPGDNQGLDNLNSANTFAITMTSGIAIGIIIPFIAFVEIKARKMKKGKKASTKIKKKEIKS